MNQKELRELDAWIAENVMGWHRMNFNNGASVPFNYLSKNKERQCTARRHGFVEGWRLLENFPNFTTDRAAAMEVLEMCVWRIIVLVLQEFALAFGTSQLTK